MSKSVTTTKTNQTVEYSTSSTLIPVTETATTRKILPESVTAKSSRFLPVTETTTSTPSSSISFDDDGFCGCCSDTYQLEC